MTPQQFRNGLFQRGFKLVLNESRYEWIGQDYYDRFYIIDNYLDNLAYTDAYEKILEAIDNKLIFNIDTDIDEQGHTTYQLVPVRH